MRIFALATVALAALAAVPAHANEARVEARGGVAWAGGASEATAGVAAGYDFDLGDSAFFGVEGSADKVLVDGADVVFGVTGRLGAKVGEKGKLFAAGGYSFNDGDAWHLGGGYEHLITDNVYLKVEYRHYFDDFIDVNSAVAGVGVKF
ncbi:MAG: hypothetical protein EP350_04410 [Alphaproteobacteria bacterium]|nr:MAG: hypothetical protein EP350_04410 [Alphaproteobacteria bacterium]